MTEQVREEQSGARGQWRQSPAQQTIGRGQPVQPDDGWAIIAELGVKEDAGTRTMGDNSRILARLKNPHVLSPSLRSG